MDWRCYLYARRDAVINHDEVICLLSQTEDRTLLYDLYLLPIVF